MLVRRWLFRVFVSCGMRHVFIYYLLFVCYAMLCYGYAMLWLWLWRQLYHVLYYYVIIWRGIIWLGMIWYAIAL